MSVNLVSIIIPLYNEAEGVNFLVNELVNSFGKNTLFDVELVFIDDGSTDETFEKIKASDFKGLNVKAIKLSKNHGTHDALRAGIFNCKGKYISYLPADLQDPPSLSIQLYEKLMQGNDIVWAQRSTYETSYVKKKFGDFYTYLMRKFTFPNYPDKGVDIVMFNEKVKGQLNANIEANSSLLLQILSLGFKQSYVQYDKGSRKIGKSKWTFKKKFKLVIDSFIAFSYAPIRIVSFCGILFFVIGIAWTIFITMRKLFFQDVLLGWPMLSSILLLGFGITNISLGIIAEYLWRTLDSSRKRPVFIIDQIFELKNNDN
jgi:dolichol-phosphate mannosyltransferase